MAAIPGSVPVTGFIAPTDTTDTFASHDALWGRGGLRTVATTSERNNITDDRLTEGMLVYCTANGLFYQLGPAPWTHSDLDWTVFTGSGSIILTGDVTGATDMTSVDRIKGVVLDLTGLSDRQTIRYNSLTGQFQPQFLPDTPVGQLTGTPGLTSVITYSINSSGVATGSLVSQPIHTVWAAPAGSAGTPSFRLLVPSDLPPIPWTQVTGTPTTLVGYGITDATSTSTTYSDPSWITSLAWSKITGTPTTLAGYGITDAVSTGATYSNPTWLTSLAWSKITGAPTSYAMSGDVTGTTSSNQITSVSGVSLLPIVTPAENAVILYDPADGRLKLRRLTGDLTFSAGQVGGYRVTGLSGYPLSLPTTPTDGAVLRYDALAGTFVASVLSGSGGTLAGDVTGPSGSNSIAAIQGRVVSAATPTVGQALVYNGSAWVPQLPVPAVGIAQQFGTVPPAVRLQAAPMWITVSFNSFSQLANQTTDHTVLTLSSMGLSVVAVHTVMLQVTSPLSNATVSVGTVANPGRYLSGTSMGFIWTVAPNLSVELGVAADLITDGLLIRYATTTTSGPVTAKVRLLVSAVE